jgi:hypothetical protein
LTVTLGKDADGEVANYFGDNENMFKFILTIGFILCFSSAAFSQSWLYGKWEGEGKERDGETWTMEFEASKGIFLIKYPSLECSGEWRLVSFNKNTARFRENIKINRTDCEPTGNVTVKRLSRNRLLFNYSYNRSRKLDSSAILTRKK